MSQYKILDDQIVSYIKEDGGCDCARLQAKCNVLLDVLAEATGREAFRVLDARLQALRKKGVIKFGAVSRKWVIGGSL